MSDGTISRRCGLLASNRVARAMRNALEIGFGAMADLVHVDQRKWPDREHYQLEARWLGRDRAGGWIHAASGTIVTRDDDEPWPLPGGFVALAPVDE